MTVTSLTSPTTPAKRIFVVGVRPSHTHTCVTGNHTWECNSPYCEEMKVDCPDHGGFEPIVQGREPWRGR